MELPIAIEIANKLDHVDKSEIIYLKADDEPKEPEYVIKDGITDNNFKSVESKNNICNEVSRETASEPNINTETAEKPSEISHFSCSQCRKMFKHETSLKSHLIKHGKKLKCEVCGKEFNRK